jgi:hypothetical protein
MNCQPVAHGKVAAVSENRAILDEMDQLVKSLDQRAARFEQHAKEMERQTELMKARSDIAKELGPDWTTIYCAMFGGAVGGILFEHLLMILAPRNDWWAFPALVLGGPLAFYIAVLGHEAFRYCLIGYWAVHIAVSDNWGAFQSARETALRDRAVSGDPAAQARLIRSAQKWQAKEARRNAPRLPRLRRWLVNFHLPNVGRLRVTVPSFAEVGRGVRGGWRLVGTFTELIAGAGGILVGGAVLLEGTPPASGVGIAALVFLAVGLWSGVSGIKKIRVWWRQG